MKDPRKFNIGKAVATASRLLHVGKRVGNKFFHARKEQELGPVFNHPRDPNRMEREISPISKEPKWEDLNQKGVGTVEQRTAAWKRKKQEDAHRDYKYDGKTWNHYYNPYQK